MQVNLSDGPIHVDNYEQQDRDPYAEISNQMIFREFTLRIEQVARNIFEFILFFNSPFEEQLALGLGVLPPRFNFVSVERFGLLERGNRVIARQEMLVF